MEQDFESEDYRLKMHRSTDHLRSWLETQQEIEELDDSVIDECIDDILKLYGTNRNLLKHLARYSNQYRLDKMQCILNKAAQQEIKVTNSNMNVINNNKNIPKSIKLNLIPKEMIEYICGYLTRSDIKQFKSTSRTISIVCLGEMSKYNVGICIANKLLHSKHNKPFKWNNNMLYDYKRYNINKTYSSIFDDLAKFHDFAEIYQLPIAIDVDGETGTIYEDETIYLDASLIVFDKRDITILTSDIQQTMTENEQFDETANILITLHYFDVYDQVLSVEKYIMIDNTITIRKLHSFIKQDLINKNNTGKYDTLKELINDEISLKIYSMDNKNIFDTHYIGDLIIDCIDNINTHLISLVFQIDVENPICKEINDYASNYYVHNLKKIHFHGFDFMVQNEDEYKQHCDERLIKISCEDLEYLKVQISSIMINRSISQHEIDILLYKIDNIFMKGLEFRVYEKIPNEILAKHISKYILDGIIECDNIEVNTIRTGKPKRRARSDWTPVTIEMSFKIVW